MPDAPNINSTRDGAEIAEMLIDVAIQIICEGGLKQIDYDKLKSTYKNKITSKFTPHLARIRSAGGLDFSGLYISDLPSHFNRLAPHIHAVNLSNNTFKNIPPVLYSAESLHTLNLTGNRITEISDNISTFSNLHALYLGQNALSYLPGNLSKLTKLAIISLNDNGFKVFPEVLYRMPWIQEINLDLN